MEFMYSSTYSRLEMSELPRRTQVHLKSFSHGLWADTAPPSPQLNAIEGRKTADVAIIGGGYTGLSAALHLAETGIDVVLGTETGIRLHAVLLPSFSLGKMK